MKINLLVRLKNPYFLAQFILALFMPVLAYQGISGESITSWLILGQVLFAAVSNPYVVMLCLVSGWTALTDPTTIGFSDSSRALTYDKPVN